MEKPHNLDDEIKKDIEDKYLSFNKSKEIIAILLEKGVDVNIKDNHDRTPLDWASENGYLEIVEILQKQLKSVSNPFPWSDSSTAVANKNSPIGNKETVVEKGMSIQ